MSSLSLHASCRGISHVVSCPSIFATTLEGSRALSGLPFHASSIICPVVSCPMISAPIDWKKLREVPFRTSRRSFSLVLTVSQVSIFIGQ